LSFLNEESLAMTDEFKIYELHADVCKTFANPYRLQIIDMLGDGEMTVTQLVVAIGIPKANVSQHLTLMRDKGVLESRKEGVNVFYRLASPKITRACRLMREVLLEGIQAKGELVQKLNDRSRG
jgi:ArsR family transcriptional regulator